MLDLTKPIQTRDGRPVTLITTQGRAPWPLVGYISDKTSPDCWHRDGSYDHSCPLGITDIINVPEPKRSGKVWVNIYPNEGHHGHNKREEADDHARRGRLACVRVPWTEGEGLEGK